MKNIIRLFLVLFFAVNTLTLLAQEVNIVPYLKQIETGNADRARESLKNLIKSNPNDPSIIFLDAVLTDDGEVALGKYRKVYSQHPESRFADASLYRVFSYYFAIGLYKKAEDYLSKLKDDYPDSPYLQSAERDIPEDEEADLIKEDVVKNASHANADEAKYTVQAGAFLNLQNAQDLKRRIEADGHTCYLSTKEVGGTMLNVVSAGKFILEKDAADLLALLKSKYALTGRVIPIK